MTISGRITPARNLSRSVERGTPTVFGCEECEGGRSHVDAAEAFGDHQGEAEIFAAGDRYPDFVAQDLLDLVVVETPDHEARDAELAATLDRLQSYVRAAYDDLAGVRRAQVVGIENLLRSAYRDGQLPFDFAAEPEDPLDQCCRRLDDATLAGMTSTTLPLM